MADETRRDVDLPRLAPWAGSIELTELQRALAKTSEPGLLSFAMGLPDSSLLPAVALERAATRVLSSNPIALQYTLPCSALKQKIRDFMATRGVDCSLDSIFLTQGAQQGLSLLAKMLLDNRLPIIEEELSYPGFQSLVDSYSPQVIRAPTDSVNGIDVNFVEDLLRRGVRPGFIYLMPTAHNPLGVTLTVEARVRLAVLAQMYRVPIIEDDPYAELYYAGTPPPNAIRSHNSNWVYYVGSFSKILGPSCRVGWIVAPPEHVRVLSIIKEGIDLNVSTLSQWIINDFLDLGNLQSHLEHLRDAYRERRNAMTGALNNDMPAGVTYSAPDYGVFCWVNLPGPLDANWLLERCIQEQRVAFLPSQAFSRNKHHNGLRLNFSHSDTSTISEGIRRIATIVRSENRPW